MSNEEKQECELMKSLLHESLYIDSEEGEQMFWRGHTLMKKLVKTKDTEILSELFDLFIEENENGVCETLESMIFQYFAFEQIVKVLEYKLSRLIELNINRAKHFAGACISHGYLEEFRDVLKVVSSKKLKNSLIEECDKWIGDDYPDEIAILRNDLND